MNGGRASDLSGQLEAVQKVYARYLREHGVTSPGVGWPEGGQHRLRFDKLATVLDPVDRSLTINDLGAGWGALFVYLEERGLPVERYVGYEISRDMLEAARLTVTDPRAIFVEGSAVTERADYSIACGTFNIKCGASDDEWRDYVVRMLRSMAEHSNRGVAFNMMSTYVDWRDELLYYGDPAFFFDFCKRELSRSVSLLHDYPLWEWTITVRL